jgi:hypothetical protein
MGFFVNCREFARSTRILRCKQKLMIKHEFLFIPRENTGVAPRIPRCTKKTHRNMGFFVNCREFACSTRILRCTKNPTDRGIFYTIAGLLFFLRFCVADRERVHNFLDSQKHRNGKDSTGHPAEPSADHKGKDGQDGRQPDAPSHDKRH